MDIDARDLTTGRRVRATLLPPIEPAPVPGGGADSVPGVARRRATLPVRQRTAPLPGLTGRAAATQVLARAVRALGRSPEAAGAALLGGFAALFAEALRRRD